jgi:hypothetical protein
MPGSFYHQLWILVRLRYLLLWAHSRTSSGRTALLLVLYLILMLILLFFSFGGFSVAFAAIELGQEEAVARGVLSGLFLSGIFISIAFGVGPRTAFSDVVLRRYPLSAAGRLAARHLIGLLDPIWIILIGTVLGLAIGFALLGAVSSLFIGLVAAWLFIIANYLTTVWLLSLINRALESGRGATILSALVFVLFSFGGLIAVWLAQLENPLWRSLLAGLLRITPAGTAAALLAGPSLGEGVRNAVLLVAWCSIFAVAVSALERRPPASQALSSMTIPWNNFYDQLARLFGKSYAPLVGKTLRYYLRCNRVRFSLATTPMFAFIGKLMVQNKGEEEFFVTLALFAFVGFASASAVTLNQFGYDGPGIRRYAIFPVSFAAAIRAGSFTSLFIGSLAIAPTLALWVLFSHPVEARMVVMLLSSALAGLFFFNALSLWTTVLSPRGVDFRSILSNHLSIGGNAVVIGGLILIFALAFILRRYTMATVLAHWWVLPLLVVLCFSCYSISERAIGPVAGARRERLIETIASGNIN